MSKHCLSGLISIKTVHVHVYRISIDPSVLNGFSNGIGNDLGGLSKQYNEYLLNCLQPPYKVPTYDSDGKSFVINPR